MTVYIDNVRLPYGRMRMCHMWADSLAELLAMADRIGVKRKWLQKPPKAQWLHFDVIIGKRDLAISYGAILTDKYGPLEHEARAQVASGDPDQVKMGDAKLNTIALLRATHRKAKLDQGRLL